MTAEPQTKGVNLYLHVAEEGGVIESKEIMIGGVPAYAGPNPLPELPRVAARVRNVLLLNPELNFVDEFMTRPMDFVLDQYDDVAAFAKSLHTLDSLLDTGQLAMLGMHRIGRMEAQLWRKIGKVLVRFDRPFLLGNQRKLIYEQGRAESDLAKGCYNQLAIQ